VSSLGLTRKDDETWRQACQRICDDFGGLHEEVLSEFDRNVAAGYSEDEAAWHALCEWDLLEVRP
jgi:hypothetical protein